MLIIYNYSFCQEAGFPVHVFQFYIILSKDFPLLNRIMLFFVDSDEATSKTSKIVPVSSGKAYIPLYIQNDVRLHVTSKCQKG